MRAAYLFAAAVIVCLTIFVHAWARADRGGETIEIGVTSVVRCDGDRCWTRGRDDFYGFDDTTRLESTLATYALGAAVLAMLIAASMVRTGPIERSFRVAFAAPCVLAAIATIAFAHGITSVRALQVGWAPIVAVAALLVGVLAIARNG
jgi:hypothetical protein